MADMPAILDQLPGRVHHGSDMPRVVLDIACSVVSRGIGAILGLDTAAPPPLVGDAVVVCDVPRRTPWPAIGRILAVLESPIRVDLEVAIDAGACGVVLLNGPPAELSMAVIAVGHGEMWLSPSLSSLLAQYVINRRLRIPHPALTARQSAVLHLLVQGRSNADVAVTLSLSIPTVKQHVSSLIRLFGVRTRAELAALAR